MRVATGSLQLAIQKITSGEFFESRSASLMLRAYFGCPDQIKSFDGRVAELTTLN